jgi:hypothetical protein
MVLLLVFCLILSIQICFTKELSSSNNLREKYSIIEDFKQRNNTLENCNQALIRFSRQNGLNKLESNPKVEKPKLEENKNNNLEFEKKDEKKMNPRTNSHKNSHSAPSRRARLSASLKLKLKSIVKTRLPSKYFSKVKQSRNRAVSKGSSKFSGLKRTFSKHLSRFSSKIKNKFIQAKKQFPGLKSKYFSKVKKFSKAFSSKSKLFLKRFKKTTKSSGKRVSALKSKFHKHIFKKSASSSLKKVKSSKQQVKNKNKVFKASKRCKRTAGNCGIAGEPRLPKSNFELPNEVIESTLKNDIITENLYQKSVLEEFQFQELNLHAQQ